MATGFVYSLKPKEVQEGCYDVLTGIRRRGNYILDVAGLEAGNYIPLFPPIAADLKTKAAKTVVRALVVETADTLATEIRVAKNPYIRDNMTPGTGKNNVVVQSIGRVSADYDKVMLAAVFDAKVDTGNTLFEASVAGGTTPKAVINLALYENHKVAEGINSVALLMRAFEIGPEELVMPLCAADKANLPHFRLDE